MSATEELAKTNLFDGMEAADLEAFAALAREVKFGPEESVYQAGSAGDSMYVIVEGAFAVRVTDEDEEEVDVAHLKPGSYFGEMEVLGGMGRTAAIVSEGDGRCYRFDATELTGLLKTNKSVAAHFYREVCSELIRRLKNTTRDMGYFKARAT